MSALPKEHLKWWVLFTMMASLSMVYVDISVLPVALPTLSRELQFSELQLQWIINAYTLTLTVLVIAGGKISQMIGLKKGFCLGLLIFAIASMLCGLSSSGMAMISARVLQGIGASLMIPSQQTILIEVFPPRERGKAVGLLVSISSIFLILGPFVGGALTEYVSWRTIFWINLPIAAFGLLMTLLIVPPFKKTYEPFDWFGFFTLGFGMTALMIGTMHIQSWGLKSPLTLALLGIGIALIIFLCRAEPKSSHPLFDLSILKTRSFIGGTLTTFCMTFLLTITIYWAIFFQVILGYSPAQAGALSCFTYAPMLIAAPIAGYLFDRFGPRLPVTIGFSCSVVSLFLFTIIATQHVIWMLLVCLFVFGMGIPLVYTPSLITVMHGISSEKKALASGLNTTIRQFSATLGLAILGTVFYKWHIWKFAHGLEKTSATHNLNTSQFEGLLSQVPSALSAFKKLPTYAAELVHHEMIASFVSAVHAIDTVSIVLGMAGIFIAWRYLKNAPLVK